MQGGSCRSLSKAWDRSEETKALIVEPQGLKEFRDFDPFDHSTLENRIACSWSWEQIGSVFFCSPASRAAILYLLLSPPVQLQWYTLHGVPTLGVKRVR